MAHTAATRPQRARVKLYPAFVSAQVTQALKDRIGAEVDRRRAAGHAVGESDVIRDWLDVGSGRRRRQHEPNAA